MSSFITPGHYNPNPNPNPKPTMYQTQKTKTTAGAKESDSSTTLLSYPSLYPPPVFVECLCNWGGASRAFENCGKGWRNKTHKIISTMLTFGFVFHKALQIGADPEAISVWGLQIQFLWLQRHTCFWIPLLTGLRSQFSPAISIFSPLGTHHFFQTTFLYRYPRLFEHLAENTNFPRFNWLANNIHKPQPLLLWPSLTSYHTRHFWTVKVGNSQRSGWAKIHFVVQNNGNVNQAVVKFQHIQCQNPQEKWPKNGHTLAKTGQLWGFSGILEPPSMNQKQQQMRFLDF